MKFESLLGGLNKDQRDWFDVTRIMNPRMFARFVKAFDSNFRFVHYTSADAAMAMIRNEEVWMRKSSCMKDYMEVQHGHDCLVGAYRKHQERSQAIFDGMFPGLSTRLARDFDAWVPQLQLDTYITCISEHDDSEDTIGRLSMWRAYGSATGVAIVVNKAPFLMPSDVLKAYTSPVEYLNEMRFEEEYVEFLNEIESNSAFLMSQGEEAVFGGLLNAFRLRILCTKHPGFHEEREWRIVYTPSYQRSERLVQDIKSIGGTPQPIYKILLKDAPEEGLNGIQVRSLIDRVIIGPTQYPSAIREAFVTLLEGVGVADPDSKVVVSDIPLRT
jgi:hypothetical protein